MKRIWTGCALALPLIAHAACSLETPVDPGTAGTSSSAGAGVQGGSVGTGGGGSGAVTAGTAGVSTTGGMAGTSSQGGNTGMSGSTSGGSAGAGTAGTGTAGTGTAGTGGTGGGAGGGGNEPTLAEVVGKLDGRLVTMKCSDMPGTDDCNSAGAVSEGQTKTCSGGRLDVQYDHPIGGTPGQMYKATMHFYGVMEPKNYGNNMGREAGNTATNQGAVPATPVPFHVFPPGMNYLATNYNTYEIHVMDQTMKEVGRYFLNSNTGEGHYTFAISYAKPIPIVGGGMVRLKIYDQNCRMIKNCGTGGVPCASKARTIDISAAMPQPGAALMQPGLGNPAEHSGQWVLIDVTGIEKM
jgi:hypothetical protein